jgi:glycosyltransferase involved in cell wall biosynthesis
MKKPIIALAHQTIIDGDAIGNDIMGMYYTLRNEGYNVGLISEYSSNNLKKYQINSPNIQNFLENTDSILLYHHSIHWEYGEKILENFKGKIIFKFHNITPPQFFKDFSSIHYEKCIQGLKQTDRFIKKYKNCIWWGDSSFNTNQLQQNCLNPGQIFTVPPFNRQDIFEKVEPNFKIIDDLIKNKRNNILFVGRVAPNKGHVHLIKIIKEYKENFDSNVHLWIIGPIDQEHLTVYFNQLSHLIKKNGLERNISFVDKKPENDVKAFYLGCDEFLCMSEHEGFCVPIIEAQQFMLPVVTYGGTALRETTGKNQIILDTFDYSFAASALFTLYTDEAAKKFCRTHGQINVDSRFSFIKITNKFKMAFESAKDGLFQ